MSTVETISELDSAFRLCSVVTMTPASSTLASEVTVLLFTVDGTGNVVVF